MFIIKNYLKNEIIQHSKIWMPSTLKLLCIEKVVQVMLKINDNKNKFILLRLLE